ncbi:hypothetical protein [Streptomyces sp. NBRC 110028]|uniref:hypothetical protein n=1 Tax=Streptomyces sp. NBRC 110028 TaxID=1621260 RepID=UPI0006E3B073|nr:hypothetical protein [Streptomyces sp. NBRC 110028]
MTDQMETPAPVRAGSRPCGAAEGPYADLPMAARVPHINREMIHYLSEVCLPRDLHPHTHRTPREAS